MSVLAHKHDSSSGNSLERDMRKEHTALYDTIIQGDCLTVAKTLPDEFADCIITSPPYFGHRAYANAPELSHVELGRETEVKDYVSKLIVLFSELQRVLNSTGTLWINIGDTYRNEQLLGVPWRVALGLQDSGWILRSEIIWHKPNAMPSSVKNRPTTDHEHIFLLSKSKDYFYNIDAIREPHVTFTASSKMKGGRNHFGKANGTPENGKNKGNPNLHRGRWDQAFHPLGRNKRTVWNIALSKFRDVHFAVFPEELVETCLLAATPENGVVLDPFIGSGTSAVVARKHGRRFLGIELVPEYVEMARQRVSSTQLHLF